MSYIVHKAIEPSNMSAKALAAVEGQDRILSPKYDGCHVVFLFNYGRIFGVRSRDNKPVRSMEHVVEALPNYYPWLAQGRKAIAGEAWIEGAEFSDISGMFRRHSNQPDMQFVPFDTVDWHLADDGTPLLHSRVEYQHRLGVLGAAWGGWDLKGPVFSPEWWHLTGTEEDIMAAADAKARELKLRGGYDGAMLALRSGTYTAGSGVGGEFMKIKPLMRESYTVTGTEPAIGDKTGKNTLALVVYHNGRPQRVSTGLKQADIDAYVADPSLIVGQVIDIEFMGLTNGGLLREPRYKGIRDDA